MAKKSPTPQDAFRADDPAWDLWEHLHLLRTNPEKWATGTTSATTLRLPARATPERIRFVAGQELAKKKHGYLKRAAARVGLTERRIAQVIRDAPKRTRK